MGQKINSNIYRLGLKNSLQWKYKYIEKNFEESTLYIYKNYKIQNYIKQILKLNGLLLHDCKIWYSETNITIYISYYVYTTTKLSYNKNSNELKLLFDQILICVKLFFKKTGITQLKIKSQNLNEKYKNNLVTIFQKRIEKLRKFKSNTVFKELLYITLITAVEETSSKLLTEFIAIQFQKIKKRHGFFLSILKAIFLQVIKSKFSKITGLKITIKGRFNGALRANQKIIQIGSVPLQSLNAKINFSNSVAFTKNGTFGIKLWICEK
jgi:ribosomal protein S3